MSWKLLRPQSTKDCGCCRGVRTWGQRGLRGKRSWRLQEFSPAALSFNRLSFEKTDQNWFFYSVGYSLSNLSSTSSWGNPSLFSPLSLQSLTHCIQRKDHWKPVSSPSPSVAELSWSSINILPWVSLTRVLHSWHCLLSVIAPLRMVSIYLMGWK